jgi:hypothetical protein
VAELTIRLRCDSMTGKKDIIVSLRSDESALAHEHEQLHRALVEKLIGQGLIQAGEVGRLVIEREAESASAGQPTQSAQPDRQALAEGN